MITILRYWHISILWLLIYQFFPLRAQVNYYAPTNLLRFADHLYQSGDYFFAVSEYQRYVYLVGASDSIEYRIARCRHLGGDTIGAMQQYRHLIAQYPNSPFHERARFQQAVLLTQQGHHRAAIDFLAEQAPHLKTPEMLWRAKWLMGVNYLYLRQWRRAEEEVQSLVNSPLPIELHLSVQQLLTAASKGCKIKYKSPTMAGVFSAIIPGSGKMYAGRWNDGLYSLLLVGLFACQAYDAFYDHGSKSTKAWIYGGIGGVFYLGNIYGSIMSAKIANDYKEQQILAKMQVQWNWD